MSRHHLLNLTTGGVAALLVGAVLFAVTAGRGDDGARRADVAVDQLELIQTIALEAAELVAAEDLASMTAARTRLGGSIYRFDRNLAALLDGGTAIDAAGRTVRLGAARGAARRELAVAADVWLRVGVPLSDLAAGSYSAYSAAGKEAIRDFEDARLELAEHLGTAASAQRAAGNRLRDARTGAIGLAGLLALALAGIVGLRWWRSRPRRSAVADPAPPAATAAPPTPAPREPATLVAPPPPPAPRAYNAPVDLEILTHAVDRLSVDMQTIGASSEKMQLAIDSVGHALQGMLYSLKEMDKDLDDGARVVHGAHSAAGYTAEVAAALLDSVKEMSRVVGNVTELARRTRQTAANLDVEAARSDRTGRGFNLAVAAEVRGLADKTSASTASIEATISDMLARTRDYEEAIGQIIKHVASINRVTRNLGEVMLDPPPPDLVPAPSPPARHLEPTVDPAAGAPAAEEMPLQDDVPLADATASDEFAAETAAAIAEASETLADTETVASAPEPPQEPVDEPPDEPADEELPETFSLDDPDAAPAPPPEQPPAAAPFVLSRAQEDAPEDQPDTGNEESADEAPAVAAPVDEDAAEPVDDEPAPEPAPVDEESAAEPAPETEPAPDAAAPEPEDEPAPPEPAPAPETPAVDAAADADGGDGDELAVSEGDDPNIFMLNRPAAPADEPETETIPADS